MSLGHHEALLVGYALAMCGQVLARRRLPHLWPGPRLAAFARPWREFGWAILAAVAVLGIGQLYQRGFLLPARGAFGPWLDLVNQLVLFAPMLLLLRLRRHTLDTAWLPRERVPLRLLIGLVLALLALTGFAAARGALDNWLDLAALVYEPSNARLAVHVFLEDLTIAILFVRLAAATRRPWLPPVAVALLFAAGHIPGNLTDGASLADLAPLALDACLAAGVLLVVARSADIWWFWSVHFALDMTQFWKIA